MQPGILEKGGDNLKRMSIVLALVLLSSLTGCGQKMAIEDGVQYSIVSFGSTDVDTKEGTTASCYLVTFTLPVAESDEAGTGTKTRGTITVPKGVLNFDSTLPVNAIVWDPPQTLEGKTYVSVRWHPARLDRAVTREKIREESPLPAPKS